MKLLFLTPQLPYPPHQGTTIDLRAHLERLAADGQPHTLESLNAATPTGIDVARRIQPDQRWATQRRLDNLPRCAGPIRRDQVAIRFEHIPVRSIKDQRSQRFSRRVINAQDA